MASLKKFKKTLEDVMCNCASRRLEGRRWPKRVRQNAPRHGLSQRAMLNIHKVSRCKRGLWPDFTVEVSDDKHPKHLSAHISSPHLFVKWGVWLVASITQHVINDNEVRQKKTFKLNDESRRLMTDTPNPFHVWILLWLTRFFQFS